jgi:hypothetical protein
MRLQITKIQSRLSPLLVECNASNLYLNNKMATEREKSAPLLPQEDEEENEQAYDSTHEGTAALLVCIVEPVS